MPVFHSAYLFNFDLVPNLIASFCLSALHSVFLFFFFITSSPLDSIIPSASPPHSLFISLFSNFISFVIFLLVNLFLNFVCPLRSSCPSVGVAHSFPFETRNHLNQIDRHEEWRGKNDGECREKRKKERSQRWRTKKSTIPRLIALRP